MGSCSFPVGQRIEPNLVLSTYHLFPARRWQGRTSYSQQDVLIMYFNFKNPILRGPRFRLLFLKLDYIARID